MQSFCLHGLLGAHPGSQPAVLAPGRETLSHDRLRETVDRTVAALNSLGIRRNDRVAIVLPNGPEMAVSFLAVASAAACAPLNPGYSGKRVRLLLSDLQPKLLLVEAGGDSPVAAVARSARHSGSGRSARSKTNAAGVFRLEGIGPVTAAPVSCLAG